MTTVAILGSGVSGVATGIRLRKAGIDDVTIYERQPDVGGTWLTNSYPGLHCDVPSHLYCYSFEPNPEWSMVYSPQAEIRDYLRRCADKYGLLTRTRFSTSVEEARYDEHDATWTLELADGERATHRVVVAATGGLTAPHIPKIQGRDTFTGEIWHSSRWRHDVDLRGRRVAVVGSAASAVQVVPEVAKVAEEVVVFSRSPNWVMPRNNAHYTPEEQDALRSTEAWNALRREQYRASMWLYRAHRRSPRGIAALRHVGLRHLRSAIDDPAMIAALTPTYDPGCKRILVSDEYYPALAQPHVQLVPHGVTALTPDSVVAADGSSWPVDVVIFCTGYRLGGRDDGRPAVEVFGRDGRRLAAALAERPESYRGVTVPGFPNYFTICGINGLVGYASLFLGAELHAEFVTRWVERIVAGEIVSVEPRADRTHEYNEAIQAELQQMSWTGDCTNFYRNREGRVTSFHPGTLGRYRRELRSAPDDDFELRRPSDARASALASSR